MRPDRRGLHLTVPALEVLAPELALEHSRARLEPPTDLGMTAGELVPHFLRRVADRGEDVEVVAERVVWSSTRCARCCRRCCRPSPSCCCRTRRPAAQPRRARPAPPAGGAVVPASWGAGPWCHARRARAFPPLLDPARALWCHQGWWSPRRADLAPTMAHRRPGVVVASPQRRLRPAGILAYLLAAIGTGFMGLFCFRDADAEGPDGVVRGRCASLRGTRSVLAGDPSGQSTQVVSHGRHHHSRLTEELQPRPSGLNAPAGSPQNRHWGPWTALVSIHPVVLAVAACIPSSLGVRFILGLRAQETTSWCSRSGRRPAATR